MAYPTITYTLTDGTTVDATHFNTNYSDMTAGFRDGSKDLNVASSMFRSLSINDASVTGNLMVGKLNVNTLTELAELNLDGSMSVTGGLGNMAGWRDWFPYAEIVGWETFDRTDLRYTKCGDEYHMAFWLDGTVNNDTTSGSTSCYFSIPTPASSGGATQTTIYALDDNTNVTDSNYNAVVGPGVGGGSTGRAYCYPNWYVFSWEGGRPSPGATWYFTDSPSTTNGSYYRLDSTASPADGTFSKVVSSGDWTNIASWVTDSAMGFDKLYAWGHNTYMYASVYADASPTWPTSVVKFMCSYYYLRDGTEYKWYDATMNDAPQYHGISTETTWLTQMWSNPDINLETTDKLVVKVSGATTMGPDSTVYIKPVNGTTQIRGNFGSPYSVRRLVRGNFRYLSS